MFVWDFTPGKGLGGWGLGSKDYVGCFDLILVVMGSPLF